MEKDPNWREQEGVDVCDIPRLMKGPKSPYAHIDHQCFQQSAQGAKSQTKLCRKSVKLFSCQGVRISNYAGSPYSLDETNAALRDEWEWCAPCMQMGMMKS